MTNQELKEQLQEDIISYLDGIGDEVIAEICNIVIKNVNKLDRNYTEADLAKAHEFGAKYTKGTVGEAQQYNFESLKKVLNVTKRF